MANDKDFKVKNGLDVGSTVTLQAYGSGSNSGTAAYTLAVDSSGNVIETTGGGGGISNVVEDTTPQLGGSLDETVTPLLVSVGVTLLSLLMLMDRLFLMVLTGLFLMAQMDKF